MTGHRPAVPIADATHAAVLVPVPAAELVVGVHRSRLDRAAGWGIPAHVTLLYPFRHPSRIDESVLRSVARAVAAQPVFTCRFARTAWFGDEVLWLAPDPNEPFRRLTQRLVEEFPDCLPYGGAHAEVMPHLTVADASVGHSRLRQQARFAQAAVTSRLPLDVVVDRVVVMVGRHAARSWRTLATVRLRQT